MPKVSVLMPVLNGEKFIGKSIESVLNQTFTDFELLIIDDGSTDSTLQIIKSYSDKRIRCISNATNTGLGNVRNQCVREALGEYLAWNDADDISLPNRLEKQIDFLDAHPDFGMVGSWVKIVDETGKKTGVFWKDTVDPEEMPASLLFHNRFTTSSVVMRRSIVPVSIFNNEFAPAEDYRVWVEMAWRAKSQNYPDVLVEYREHGQGQSKVKPQNQKKAVDKIIMGQLEKLGVKPTGKELLIHKTNYGSSGPDITEFLVKREQWLLNLAQKNSEAKLYDEKTFLHVLAKQWLVSCRANPKDITFKSFRRSELTRYLSFRKDWRDIIGFCVSMVK